MKAISNFRYFAAVLSLLAVALPAVNGQAVAVGTLLAAMGIAVVDPTCSSSWDWLAPYISGTNACGCRQSYVIVQSHNKGEDRTGPKMVYDHSEFFMSNEFKGNPPANFAFGALCQTSKSAVVPPMGTGGAEVGNAEGYSNGLQGGKLYWDVYGEDGAKLEGCQLIVSVENYAAFGFGKNEITSKLSGCESYTGRNQVPGLTIDMSEFIQKEEGASRIIYVYMKDALPKAVASSVEDEFVPWPVEDFSGNKTAMAPGMAPGAAPTIPSPNPKPASSPSPVAPASSASLAFSSIFATLCVAAANVGVF